MNFSGISSAVSRLDFNFVWFLVIKSSGLNCDKRLIVNRYFETNDPSIYAIGTITKCKDFPYADRIQHDQINPIECGEKLANHFISHIISSLLNTSYYSYDHKTYDYTDYKEPVFVHFALLDRYNYIYVRPPGPYRSAEKNDKVFSIFFIENILI